MSYFEQAKTISTAADVGVGHTWEYLPTGVVHRGRAVVFAKHDHEAWVSLPERDQLVCQACGCKTVTVYRDVLSCSCGERWRMPLMGGD